MYQRLLYLNSALNSVIYLTTPTTITFLSITFFVFFTNKPLEPSYIVLAMVCINYKRKLFDKFI